MKTIVKNNLSEKYSRGTIVIHWLSLILIMILIPTGFIMSDMKAGVTKLNLLQLHLVVGILVFALTLIRVWFFFRSKRPSKLDTGSRLHNKLVIWIENSFYYLLILLCISGIATVVMAGLGSAIQHRDALLLPGKTDAPSLPAHKALAIVLIILLIGHVAGVLNHYIKNRENTLKRMIR